MRNRDRNLHGLELARLAVRNHGSGKQKNRGQKNEGSRRGEGSRTGSPQQTRDYSLRFNCRHLSVLHFSACFLHRSQRATRTWCVSRSLVKLFDRPSAGSQSSAHAQVSFDLLRGRTLPYIDNLVNLLIDRRDAIAAEERLRVLVPGGVAYVQRGGRWIQFRKPAAGYIDEWTHFLHGPDNNSIAKDLVVDTPRHLQWVNEPAHARSHEHFQTVSASVSANGRFFSIVDEGPTLAVALPAKNQLVARDAFNGVLLWKRPIGQWESHLRLFRGGPAWLARRLVAVKDRVYVTLGYDQPVTALDGATGETIVTFTGSEQASEIVVAGGTLFVVISDPEAQAAREKARRFGKDAPQAGQKIVQRNLDIQPTIKVRPGWPLRVIVHKDLVLRPYEERRSAR